MQDVDNWNKDCFGSDGEVGFIRLSGTPANAPSTKERTLGTIFSALDIGRAGMVVAQVQLDVAGHNITNVNKEGFSRQRVDLTTRVPNYLPYGTLGRGPAIEGIRRIRDGFVDQVYRDEIPTLGEAVTAAEYYTRMEDIFQEPSDSGFSERMNTFFDALHDFSNNVEELPVRASLLSEADSVAASLNQVASQLDVLRTNANEEVRNIVPEINSLARRIAELNTSIRDSEITGRMANDLRDDRDLLVDQLAQIVRTTTRERSDGQVDVLLGGVEIVSGNKYRELEAHVDPTIDLDRPDLLTVRFVDNGEAANITGGELRGVLDIRDTALQNLQDRMDESAKVLISSINRIHSQGRGLEGINIPLRSTNAVNGAFSPLSGLAGLPFDVQDGSFDIVVYDSAGNVSETITVPVVATGPIGSRTTLADIEAAINGGTNISASVSADGILTITPGAGYSFRFANDSSDALVALGLNGLFTGSRASDIAVSQQLKDHPEYLSSGNSMDILTTGDNSVALQMAAVRNQKVLSSNSQTPDEYYQSTIVEVGINSRANLDNLDVAQAFVDDFNRRRQEVSGVSLDEEVTNLIQYQRAFEGAARVIQVADRFLETLLNIV